MPFTKEQTEHVRGKDFTCKMEKEDFNCYKICQNEDNLLDVRKVKPIEVFGYVHTENDESQKNIFVPYPEDVQHRIRNWEGYEYTAGNKWTYQIDPKTMTQKNTNFNTVRPIHAIASVSSD